MFIIVWVCICKQRACVVYHSKCVEVNGNLTWSALLFQYYVCFRNKLGSWCLRSWVTSTFPHLMILQTLEFVFNIHIFKYSYSSLYVRTRTIQMDTWENHSYPLCSFCSWLLLQRNITSETHASHGCRNRWKLFNLLWRQKTERREIGVAIQFAFAFLIHLCQQFMALVCQYLGEFSYINCNLIYKIHHKLTEGYFHGHLKVMYTSVHGVKLILLCKDLKIYRKLGRRK